MKVTCWIFHWNPNFVKIVYFNLYSLINIINMKSVNLNWFSWQNDYLSLQNFELSLRNVGLLSYTVFSVDSQMRTKFQAQYRLIGSRVAVVMNLNDRSRVVPASRRFRGRWPQKSPCAIIPPGIPLNYWRQLFDTKTINLRGETFRFHLGKMCLNIFRCRGKKLIKQFYTAVLLQAFIDSTKSFSEHVSLPN